MFHSWGTKSPQTKGQFLFNKYWPGTYVLCVSPWLSTWSAQGDNKYRMESTDWTCALKTRTIISQDFYVSLQAHLQVGSVLSELLELLNPQKSASHPHLPQQGMPILWSFRSSFQMGGHGFHRRQWSSSSPKSTEACWSVCTSHKEAPLKRGSFGEQRACAL